MATQSYLILDKLSQIEKNLQELKVELLLGNTNGKKASTPYEDDDLLAEIRKVRNNLWNEKYSKTV